MRPGRIVLAVALFTRLATFADASLAQATEDPSAAVISVQVEPTDISAEIGQPLQFNAVGLDAAGKPVAAPVTMWFAAPWDLGSADANGIVRPQAPGLLRVGAKVGNKIGYARVMVRAWPVEGIDVEPAAVSIVVGGHAQLSATPRTARGNPRRELSVEWATETPSVAAVDAAGVVMGLGLGHATIRASVGGVVSKTQVEVIANPVSRLSVTAATSHARTGDVVHFTARSFAASGPLAKSIAPSWSVEGDGATIWPDGAFVAEQPGTYVVSAEIGNRRAQASVVIAPRNVQRELEVVAHVIPDQKMPYAEQWIFGNAAYLSSIGDKLWVYDISDPEHPKLSDFVTVDARLINDTSVSADGKVGILTREGTSNRRNGIVFLDTSDPLHPKVASEYTQTVTGGVHSAFLDGHYAYITDDATGSMRVIDFSNVKAPKEVARWQVENPISGTTEYPLGIISSGRFLHDVYVKDGLAYLSYWRDGLVILDVGSGIKKGSPENPQFVSQLRFDYYQPYGNGWNAGAHVAFRYKNYVYVGDEVLPAEYNIASNYRIPVQGIVHVVDVADIAHPRQVASYAVPEAGAHNMWVEDDLLYMGYYNGGGRVLDVSGELRGDLYRQGREVARLATGDPEGFRPNLPMAWGGQPHQGLIYFNDINSGLWITRLGKPKMSGSTTGGPN
jgi:hypothetical protein